MDNVIFYIMHNLVGRFERCKFMFQSHTFDIHLLVHNVAGWVVFAHFSRRRAIKLIMIGIKIGNRNHTSMILFTELKVNILYHKFVHIFYFNQSQSAIVHELNGTKRVT
jgi:hypothetical protein